MIPSAVIFCPDLLSDLLKDLMCFKTGLFRVLNVMCPEVSINKRIMWMCVCTLMCFDVGFIFHQRVYRSAVR